MMATDITPVYEGEGYEQLKSIYGTDYASNTPAAMRG